MLVPAAVGSTEDLGVAGTEDMRWVCVAHSNEPHPNTAVSRPANGIQIRLVGKAGVLLLVDVGKQLVEEQSSVSSVHLQPVDLKHDTCQNRPSPFAARVL